MQVGQRHTPTRRSTSAVRNVDAAYRHLKSHGIDVKPPKVAPYGMKQLYVSDPDGYLLCFQWQAA
jgi:uncharacterized glyoxalase superfamily protein PhnB